MCKIWRLLMHPRVYLTVEPVLFVFMFAQFLSYPVYQSLLYKIVCDRTANCSISSSSSSTQQQNSTDGDGCGLMPTAVEESVQREASHWILYTNLALGLPSILFSTFYGSVSDQLGRKLFLFLPAMGAALNTGVLLEVAYFGDRLPLYLCLVGALFAGAYGGYAVLNFACYAYAADVTAARSTGRTRQIGLLESMTYLGATLSLLVGGVWMEKDESHSYISIFWCVLACQLVVMAYTLLALPESVYFSSSSGAGQRFEESSRGGGYAQQQLSTYARKFSRTRKFSWACRRFLEGVGHGMCGFLKLLGTDWRLSLMMLAFFVVEINFLGIGDVVFLYARGKPLCWGSRWVGYFLALKVFCNGLASLLALPLLLALHVSDAVIVMVGMVSGAIALVMMGVATKTWIMFLGKVLSLLLLPPHPSLSFHLSSSLLSSLLSPLLSSLANHSPSLYPFQILCSSLVVSMAQRVFCWFGLVFLRQWNMENSGKTEERLLQCHVEISLPLSLPPSSLPTAKP